MGLMNRVKHKSIEDVKDYYTNLVVTMYITNIGGLPIEECLTEYAQNKIKESLSSPSPFYILYKEWGRVLKTNILFLQQKYVEESCEDKFKKILENRTKHLKIDKEDLICFIDNFRLASLQTKEEYLYPNEDIDLLSAYQNVDDDENWRMYIFDDNIKKHENGCGRLRTFYICYEISRALLQTRNDAIDILNDKEKPVGKTTSDLAEVYTVFRRTSLSVGLALYLCRKIFDDNINDIVKSISDNKILDLYDGLKYSNNEQALVNDIKNWLYIQEKGSIEYIEVYRWFFEIKREWK